MPINARLFTVNVVDRIMYADISDLGLELDLLAVELFSPKTDTTTWMMSDAYRDEDGFITHWEFIPDGDTAFIRPHLEGWTITVYNN